MSTFWITLSLSIPLGMKAFNYPGKCTLRLHFIPSSLSIFLANKTSILQEFYYRNNFPNFSLLTLYIRRLTSIEVEEVVEMIEQVFMCEKNCFCTASEESDGIDYFSWLWRKIKNTKPAQPSGRSKCVYELNSSLWWHPTSSVIHFHFLVAKSFQCADTRRRSSL